MVLLAFTAMCTPVSADVTEEEIKQAIDNGTAWLAAQQNDDGSWGTSDKVARTAFAVKKLEHHAVDPKYGYGLDSPFDPAYPYADNVTRGLNYIFANAQIIKISNQTHDGRVDNPDTNGNGIGVSFTESGWHQTYQTSIALMAIAESGAQDKIVNVSGSPVNGWTYHDVAVDTVDYLAFGQTDSGGGIGGWDYSECNNSSCWSDNSNTGYAVLGLQYAEAPKPEGLTIPQFVKTELNIWIDYIQCKEGVPCTGFGGSGYGSPCSWVNILKTGNLLKEMAFVGDTATTPRVVNATAYLCCHWNETADPGWRPNHYQAMYTTMK
ncbi:MAG: hypothetical protein QMD22_04660 [archaeon]|nr:hypothetical protein [archaeon]